MQNNYYSHTVKHALRDNIVNFLLIYSYLALKYCKSEAIFFFTPKLLKIKT